MNTVLGDRIIKLFTNFINSIQQLVRAVVTIVTDNRFHDGTISADKAGAYQTGLRLLGYHTRVGSASSDCN